MTWLKKFLDRFSEAAESHPRIKRPMDLANIERSIQRFKESDGRLT